MDLDLDLLLKLGVGLLALWEVRKLRGEVKDGFASVASSFQERDGRLNEHETRIQALEEGASPQVSRDYEGN